MMIICMVVQLNFLLLYKYFNAISIDIIGGITIVQTLGLGIVFISPFICTVMSGADPLMYLKKHNFSYIAMFS